MTDNRPTHNTWLLEIAHVISKRGTCVRRKVGCVLVNSRFHIIGTGYNGRPAGIRNCLDEPCDGANMPSGTGLDLCQAVHAEANALLQCKDVGEIFGCYVTTSPCIHCVKMLMNTSCQAIVFSEPYPSPGAKELWERSNRIWLRVLEGNP